MDMFSDSDVVAFLIYLDVCALLGVISFILAWTKFKKPAIVFGLGTAVLCSPLVVIVFVYRAWDDWHWVDAILSAPLYLACLAIVISSLRPAPGRCSS